MKKTALLGLCLLSFTGFAARSQSQTEPLGASPRAANATLFIGKGFPVGKVHSLTREETSQVRELLTGAKTKDVPSGSPHPRLCYVKLDNRTYYFIANGEPVSFTLSTEQKRKFIAFVTRLVERPHVEKRQ